jgi:predicted nucleotidyltransferase
VNKILDLDGWDLQKMLRLLYKSNPSVFEWNQSTIIYCKTPQWERISGEIPRYFQVATGFQHYLHLAKGNCRWFLKAAEVWEKKYFHVLRAILACYWILHHHTPPPLNFIQLCDAELDCSIRPAVDRLLEKKRAGKTKRKGKRIEVLNDYIAVSFADLEKKITQLPKEPYPDWQELNRLFLDTLNSCSFAFMSGGIS